MLARLTAINAWLRMRAVILETMTATTVNDRNAATLVGSVIVNVKIGGRKKKL